MAMDYGLISDGIKIGSLLGEVRIDRVEKSYVFARREPIQHASLFR